MNDIGDLGDELEIGTWSNELAGDLMNNVTNGEITEWNPNNYRYGSPTSWLRAGSSDDLYDSLSGSETDSDDTSLDSNDGDRGLRIEFKSKDLAEAVELNRKVPSLDDVDDNLEDVWECFPDENDPVFLENRRNYHLLLKKFRREIETTGVICKANENFQLPWAESTSSGSKKFSSNSDVAPSVDNTKIHFCDDFKDRSKNLRHAMFVRQSVLKQQMLEEVKLFRCQDVDNPVSAKCTFETFPEKTQNELFSLDKQPELNGHPGPSPSIILQAMTMSNANDGINLERMETIGDSFLKYAITTYLYCTHENVHEGKLSHLRSKQVSNLNLYRLGKQKMFAESMIATKFEPHDNWLPPCYYVPRELERALIASGLPASHWNRADIPAIHAMPKEQIAELVRERTEQIECANLENGDHLDPKGSQCFVPYNLITQHSVPDKSVADCVEALIGAYLVACGPRGALLFMSWLGIKVLPFEEIYASSEEELMKDRKAGHLIPVPTGEPGPRAWKQVRFGALLPPKPPLLRHVADPEDELSRLLTGFDALESELEYRFRDRSYLLQAVTHASYSLNQLTDCYQRLEFLGDAVLDYLITRYLFEDPRHHSPGSLTDLRSALVNNTMFASLAVRHGFHRFFRHQCPSLHEVIDRFVRIQQENNHAVSDECYLVSENDAEEAEDVEVPKALGDVFESLAGAIYLDSGMKLDAVWRVYYRIMKTEIDTFSTNVPKSPIRELLELEPETAQFSKPEKLADGRRVRVAVEVFGKGVFKGIGRNYRIAKCTAAKCALKQLKRRGLIDKRQGQENK